MNSLLELKWTDRILTGSQTPRRFLDFVVDGTPLYPMMGDFISVLGWLDESENELAVQRLLRKAEPDAPQGRTCIYVCPECGGLGCGAVTTVIERVGDRILWRDFGFQNDYEAEVMFDDFKDFGPFTFDVAEYRRAIKGAE